MYFKSIQMLRAFAAIFVVLFHLNFFWHKHGIFLPHLFDNMFGSIDLFFVISGFVLFQSAIKFKHGFKQFLIFIQKRLTRLYAFYWIIMPLLVISGLSYEKLDNPWQFLKSFFFIPSYPLVIFTTWTIIYEIYFYFLMSLFVLNKKLKYLLILVFFLCIISTLHISFYGHSLKQHGLYNEFIIEFFLGTFAFLLFKKISQFIAIALLIAGCLFFAFSFYTYYSHFISFGIPSFLILISLVNLEHRGKIKIPGTFVIIGNASYVLYLIHGPAIEKISVYINGYTIVNNIIILVSVAILILFSIVIHKYIEKPLLAYLNRIIIFE